MSYLHLLGAIALASLAALPARAHDYRLGALEIEHPYAVATPAGAGTAAGYLSIRNLGDAPDALVAVEAEFAEAMLHATELDAAGVARMVHLDRLEIPAGATVTLEPRGLHVMFLGLEAPLVEGEAREVTLRFERAGEIAVELAVEPRRAPGAEHEGH